MPDGLVLTTPEMDLGSFTPDFRLSTPRGYRTEQAEEKESAISPTVQIAQAMLLTAIRGDPRTILLRQFDPQTLRQHCDPILVTFALPHRHRPTPHVHILHPQSHQL
jgi:hypothetical protein